MTAQNQRQLYNPTSNQNRIIESHIRNIDGKKREHNNIRIFYCFAYFKSIFSCSIYTF